MKATMKIITYGDNMPRILYADKIEPATLKPGYIILDECRTIALADIMGIVPVTVALDDEEKE